MEAVLGARHEQVGAGGQGQHEDGGPGGVEQGVGARDEVGQDHAGLLGGQARGVRRHEQAHGQVGVHRHGGGVGRPLGVDPGHRGPAVQGGGHVVGVPLEVGGQGEDGVVVQGLRLADQAPGQQEAGQGGTGRGAHAGAVGDAVDAAHLKARLGGVGHLQAHAQGPDHQVGVVGGDHAGPHPLDVHVGGAHDGADLDLVVVAEGHAEGVEPGAHVGRRRGDPHGGTLSGQAHGHCPSTRWTETTSSTRSSRRRPSTAASRWKTLAG